MCRKTFLDSEITGVPHILDVSNKKRKNILTILSLQLICWKCNIFKYLSWNIKWNNAYNLFCMAWNAQFLFNLMLQNTTWEADSVSRSPPPTHTHTFVSAEWDVDTDWIIRRSTMRGGGSIFFFNPISWMMKNDKWMPHFSQADKLPSNMNLLKLKNSEGSSKSVRRHGTLFAPS